MVCAGCVGAISVFACVECGSEEHPYGYTRCARCFLRERLTTVLTEPLTGQIHPHLVPVFDTLLAGKRPQSTLWWLTKRGSIASSVLAGLAAGQLAISHDTFRHELPLDRRHAYLRELLTATEVLPPYAPAIERIGPWLTDKLTGLPAEQAEVLARFAHWHVLRRMRRHADAGTLTSSISTADAPTSPQPPNSWHGPLVSRQPSPSCPSPSSRATSTSTPAPGQRPRRSSPG